MLTVKDLKKILAELPAEADNLPVVSFLPNGYRMIGDTMWEAGLTFRDSKSFAPRRGKNAEKDTRYTEGESLPVFGLWDR